MAKPKIAITLLIPAFIILGFVWLASAEKPVEEQSRAIIEPALAKVLASASPDDFLPVIVILKDQESPEKWKGARGELVANLRSFAQKNQASLKSYLDEARALGLVESYKSFWIFNGFALKAKSQAIHQLAFHPSVSMLLLDHYRQWLKEKPSTAEASQSVEWNIERIRAPQAWSTLNVSGTGAVVAVMDTGADWLHPALKFNYRGYNPHGPAKHSGNWFDPVTGSSYPFDDHGHGTHVLGIAVGRDGIGVAPGARWIAVKVLDGNGYGYDSWIHAGFQWLLAPEDDPSLAPDVVNCSWGEQNAMNTVFQPDLRALRAAGIIPVFAAGNNGPGPASVNSPASLPEAIAVGATDPYDEVAYFSSRGPSPWNEIRPHVVAPGVHVRSSFPGGTYATWSGTSMAAPHVTGLMALMRSISPTVNVTHALFIVTSTAVPLSTTTPNNESGWGRIDAFAAVASLLNAGTIQGAVQSTSGTPIPGATISARPRDGTGGGSTTADASGHYALFLAPGLYNVTAFAFGYFSHTIPDIVVSRGTTTTVDFTLQPQPTGTLQVRIYEAVIGRPLTATISLPGTPLSATASLWSFSLPPGDYTVVARALSYRVGITTATVTVNETTEVTLNLDPAPSILLVDSGAWYYGSQIHYYRQALDDLLYAYDEWAIRRIPQDLPPLELLEHYDLVIWSSPQDAPGYIGADKVIVHYLSNGGKLFLSGQDIGFLDGGGVGFSSYYQNYLKALFVQDSSNSWALQGLPGGPFAGLSFSIANGDGADNQLFPDVVEPADPSEAVPVLAYSNGGYGGLAVGVCLNYRVLYLSFGFEAIADRLSRKEVMERAISWLISQPAPAGLQVLKSTQTIIGRAGDLVTHGVVIRNIGSQVDTFAINVEGGRWPVTLSSSSVTLEPCAIDKVEITVAIPPDAGWDERDTITLTLRSTISPALSVQVPLTTKTPAPILLVDNDLWYEQAEKYKKAMAETNLPYDLLEITGSKILPEALSWYPIIVWWTGYNWYNPVRAEDEEALTHYLLNGGRLFLSSQDFLFCRGAGSSFCKGTGSLLPLLGVLTWTEDVTPTMAVGVPEEPIGESLGPWSLAYPYQNWSDALEPMPGTMVVFRDQEKRAIGLARRGNGNASVFFAFPFETLPEEARPQVMERVVGFLSWLGSSSFSVNPISAMPGQIVTWTVSLRNDGPKTVTALFSTTIASGLTFLPSSLTGPALYDPNSSSLSWLGPISPGESITISYCTSVNEDIPPRTVILQEAMISLEEQKIRFRREAKVKVGMADLSPSTLECTPVEVLSGSPISCVLTLRNAGIDAQEVSALIPFPSGSRLISGSASRETGNGEIGEKFMRWSGSIPAGSSSSIRWGIEVWDWNERTLYHVVLFGEKGEAPLERALWLKVQPYKIILPLIFKSFP